MKEKTLEKKAVKKTEILAGFLGADALVKQSNDKKEKLISFSVATNIDADTVKWTQVNLHEDLASTLEKDLKKGDFVELKGLTQAYEKKDGNCIIESDLLDLSMHYDNADASQVSAIREAFHEYFRD